MGRTYLFECPKCGYKAKVSGGADQGRYFSVQTVLCRDCRRLHDAVLRWRVPLDVCSRPLFGLRRWRFDSDKRSMEKPPSVDMAINRLPPPGARRFKWIDYKALCPVSAFHRIQFWNEPGRCPRCEAYMEKAALHFRLWE